ncbi:hypothetical protein ACO2JO_04850 [Leptospira interrogans]
MTNDREPGICQRSNDALRHVLGFLGIHLIWMVFATFADGGGNNRVDLVLIGHEFLRSDGLTEYQLNERFIRRSP